MHCGVWIACLVLPKPIVAVRNFANAPKTIMSRIIRKTGHRALSPIRGVLARKNRSMVGVRGL